MATLELDILPQPDDFTCGPTCLHAVLRYHGHRASLGEIIKETPRLENGGTLGVMLARQAIQRGFRARIYTYNLRIFDPTWFSTPGTDLLGKLRQQARHKHGTRFRAATQAYCEFLEAGGEICLEDLTRKLIRGYLKRGVPILTGLSATYLYRTPREHGPDDDYDDVRGEPSGHFVVLCGYEPKTKQVIVADPMDPNPVAESRHYRLGIDRLVGAILLGVLTYDANLLIIEPAGDA
jgi:hypothetical protein